MTSPAATRRLGVFCDNGNVPAAIFPKACQSN